MLSNDATNFVLQALKGLMAVPGQCFTAYDVTKLARSLTKDRKVAVISHDDVREVIHSLYDQGFLAGYQRIAHSFTNPNGQGIVTAQLFVPPNGSAWNYDPNKGGSSAAAILKQQNTTSDGAACDAASCGDCECDESERDESEDDDFDADLDDELDELDNDIDDDVEEMTAIIKKPGVTMQRDDLLTRIRNQHNAYTPTIDNIGGITPLNSDAATPLAGATSILAMSPAQISAPTPASAPASTPISPALPGSPPVNLGGQVIIQGGGGHLPPPPPPPVVAKKPVSAEEQAAYLKKWNTGIVEENTANPSLINLIRDKVASKLRDLLS